MKKEVTSELQKQFNAKGPHDLLTQWEIDHFDELMANSPDAAKYGSFKTFKETPKDIDRLLD